MKVLYVTTSDAPAASVVLGDLLWHEPNLVITPVVGAAGALVEIRTVAGYGALFVSPSVPHNEALALIASIRRDRIPIAIVAVITDANGAFFAPAVTAGADDVLVLRGDRLIAVEDTLRRVRQNRHISPDPGQPRLRVLYAGHDEVTWRLIEEIPFVQVRRTSAADDGSVGAVLPAPGAGVHGETADVLVIDEYPGTAHALQVVKWIKAELPGLPVIVLAAPTAGDLGGAALELGADEVVSKAGTYRRRLVASLHRMFLRNLAAEAAPVGPVAQPVEPVAPPTDDDAPSVQSLQAEREQLLETQAFERALRERDREELISFRRALREEQERRIVLEGTLRHTEDRAKAELSALEEAHDQERRRLEEDMAEAAERLHRVANDTQLLQTRLDRQLAERVAERDRLVDNALIGHALFTRDGRLVRCSDSFATMLGYPTAGEAVESSRHGAFAGTPDHVRLVELLSTGAGVDRVESTARKSDGRPVRVLTSAALVASSLEGEGTEHVERLFVDLSDRTNLEVELRLARRLESAGRLAAEMGPDIEAAFGEERDRAELLVKQLIAFSRHQAKPAGFLSLNDAIGRVEAVLKHVAGDGIDLQFDLGPVEPVTGGEDEIERLVIELVASAAGSLPFGGRLTLQTAAETNSTFVLRTSLTAVAAGYGVLSAHPSPSLARLVARCGGVLRTAGEAGRSSTLHVHLPC